MELLGVSPGSSARICDFSRILYISVHRWGDLVMRLEARTQIAERAYYIWQSGGCRHDSSLQDWLQAEAEIMRVAHRSA
jgi:hypothetical protein